MEMNKKPFELSAPLSNCTNPQSCIIVAAIRPIVKILGLKIKHGNSLMTMVMPGGDLLVGTWNCPKGLGFGGICRPTLQYVLWQVT